MLAIFFIKLSPFNLNFVFEIGLFWADWQTSSSQPFDNCLTTKNQQCPVCEHNSTLWNSGIEANKDVVRKQIKLSKDLNTLTLDIKNNKSFDVKNGECVPSEYFINTFNSVINRANQK